MTAIAPTGNGYGEDFQIWSDTFGNTFLNRFEFKIVLIESDDHIIGFFAYACKDNTFMMLEIQFSNAYQGKYGIFRKLYHFVTKDLPNDLMYVEAYANNNNAKSIAVLSKLGLKNVGTNKTGMSFHFKGTYKDYLLWLNDK